MNRNRTKQKQKASKRSKNPLAFLAYFYNLVWKKRNWAMRIIAVLISLIIFIVGVSYGIASWYIHKHADEPLKYGTTFIPRYARFYQLDPKETFHDLIYDMGFERFRLVSYWDDIEKNQGQYDFEELDWQFKMAEEAGVEINLSLGLRQPRWPECHMPNWAEQMPKDQWYVSLKDFMGKVVERYKDSPALVSYQVENEFFMTIFGDCPDFNRDRLVDEYNYVKSLDPSRPIVVTRSNNWGGIPINEPTPDVYGIAVYKRVWDKTLTKRYFEYPYPSWFYATLAGAGEIYSGKNMIIHELQMEPWLDESTNAEMNDVNSIAEQDKSMNAERLKDRFSYAEKTGMKTIDTWGAEWWYWRKEVANDPSLWNVAKEEIANAKAKNKELDR